MKTTAEESYGLQQLLADLPREDRSTGSQPGEGLVLKQDADWHDAQDTGS